MLKASVASLSTYKRETYQLQRELLQERTKVTDSRMLTYVDVTLACSRMLTCTEFPVWRRLEFTARTAGSGGMHTCVPVGMDE